MVVRCFFLRCSCSFPSTRLKIVSPLCVFGRFLILIPSSTTNCTKIKQNTQKINNLQQTIKTQQTTTNHNNNLNKLRYNWKHRTIYKNTYNKWNKQLYIYIYAQKQTKLQRFTKQYKKAVRPAERLIWLSSLGNWQTIAVKTYQKGQKNSWSLPRKIGHGH